MFSSKIIWIIINIMISIIIIYSLHQLWEYLKDTYSTKKTKDLVNTQIKKYKKMMDEIQQTKTMDTPPILSEENILSMNDDLTEFMNSQMMN